MIKLSEIIKVPIEIGDTVLGGKFKNKRIVVKSIGKNDKGDITINNKPMMKFRILPKEAIGEGKEELYKLYTQAMKMMPGSPKQKELIKKITKVRKKLKMDELLNNALLNKREGLGPSDEARRYMMLQLYGSNFVTNYKRLLNGIKNEKTGVIKKSWKDFQAIYNQIEKEIKQII
jgi:hypothetical protein